jgi:hypothetical protein
MEAHRHNNTGIEEVSWFKTGNGHDRVLIGFELPTTMVDTVRKAKLRMLVWAESKPENNFTAKGLNVGVWPVTTHWIEGNGRWDRILDNFSTNASLLGSPECGEDTGGPNCPFMEETYHCGVGATWTCGQDSEIGNNTSGTLSGGVYSGCQSSGNNWDGTGVTGTPTDCSFHPCHQYLQNCSTADEKPACATQNADLDASEPSACAANPDDTCYDMNVAEIDCTYRTVDCNLNPFSSRLDLAEWDVTADVNAIIACNASPTCTPTTNPDTGNMVLSWYISKFLESGDATAGKVRYFSRDGVRFWYEKGIPDANQLSPQLLLDLN